MAGTVYFKYNNTLRNCYISINIINKNGQNEETRTKVCVCLCMFVCVSASLYVCLSVGLYVSLSRWMHNYMYFSMCMSVCLPSIFAG